MGGSPHEKRRGEASIARMRKRSWLGGRPILIALARKRGLTTAPSAALRSLRSHQLRSLRSHTCARTQSHLAQLALPERVHDVVLHERVRVHHQVEQLGGEVVEPVTVAVHVEVDAGRGAREVEAEPGQARVVGLLGERVIEDVGEEGGDDLVFHRVLEGAVFCPLLVLDEGVADEEREGRVGLGVAARG